MAQANDTRRAGTGSIVRVAFVALLALGLLLALPQGAANAQSGDPPTAARVSPSDHEIILEIGQSQEFEAEVNSIHGDIIVWTATVDGWSEQFLLNEPVGSHEASFSHTFEEAGVFAVGIRFTGVDSGKLTASWQVTVVKDSSLPPNSAPVITGYAPTQVFEIIEGSDPNLIAYARDDDSNLTSAKWLLDGEDTGEGDAYDNVSEAESRFGHLFSTEGTYEVTVVFADSREESVSLTFTITIRPAPADPPSLQIVECLPTEVEPLETVTCSATLSGGSVSTYAWSAPGGDPPSGTGQSFTTSWDSAGAKQVSLEVCNDDGCDSAAQTVTVNDPAGTPTTTTQPTEETTGETPIVTTSTTPPPGETTGVTPTTTVSVPPEVTALTLQTPQELEGLEAGSAYTFAARATDANADIVSLWWHISSDFSTYHNEVEIGASSSVESRLAYRIPREGRYHIRVDFVDSKSGAGTTDWTFFAEDSSPKVDTLVCTPTSPEVGETVRCDATLSGGDSRRELWVAYDSVQGIGSGLNHSTVWDTPGEKQVTLMVCNWSLQCSFLTQAIQVLPEISPPEIDSLGCDQDVVHVGENLHCSPRISGGPPTEYSWTARHGFPSTGNSETFAPDWRDRGERPVALEVCNRIGECDSSSQTITVGHPIPPPVIKSLGCEPLTVEIEEEVDCEAILAENDQEVFYDRSEDDIFYSWSVSSVSAALFEWENEELTVEWYESGKERIRLEVCNIENECDTERQTITVLSDRGSFPQIHSLGCPIGPVEVDQSLTCTPDVSASGRVEYYWTAYSGSPRNGGSRRFETMWSTAGTKTVELEVCVGNDCVDAEREMEVVEPVTVNSPPVATRVSPDSSITVEVGQSRTFVASATDPDDDLRSFGWQVTQRSTPATPPLISSGLPTQSYDHAFNSPGHYLVSVAFYDSAGQSSAVIWEVTVVENPSIPLSDLQTVNASLLALQDIKREWLACLDENQDNETLCLRELGDGASARVATANLSSIFDQYQNEGLGEDFIKDVEAILTAAGLAKAEAQKARLRILQGAICGQACFEWEAEGSESPWYLVGWLLAGFVPVVDIFTDGRDFIVSGVGCVSGLLSLDGCEWVDLGINGLGLATSIVPVGVGQAGNIAQAGLHIGKYAVRVPKATGGALRALTRIPLIGDKVDKAVVAVVNGDRFKDSVVGKTEFLGEFLGKKGNLYPLVRIDFPEMVELAILDKHYIGGASTAGKGLFDRGTSINSLVNEANRVVPRLQVAGIHPTDRLQWIVEAGERIGLARVELHGDTYPTSVYTVITELDGTVVTAHPGIPKHPTLIGAKYDLDLLISGGN